MALANDRFVRGCFSRQMKKAASRAAPPIKCPKPLCTSPRRIICISLAKHCSNGSPGKQKNRARVEEFISMAKSARYGRESGRAAAQRRKTWWFTSTLYGASLPLPLSVRRFFNDFQRSSFSCSFALSLSLQSTACRLASLYDKARARFIATKTQSRSTDFMRVEPLELGATRSLRTSQRWKNWCFVSRVRTNSARGISIVSTLMNISFAFILAFNSNLMTQLQSDSSIKKMSERWSNSSVSELNQTLRI